MVTLGSFFHFRKQVRGDLLARHVVMEENARDAVPALSRIAEISLFVARKGDAAPDELPDDVRRTSDHQFHRARVVLVMSRAHRVVKIFLVVVVRFENADPALRQKGIALVRNVLAEHQNGDILRQMQGAVEPRNPRSRDQNAVFFFDLRHNFLTLQVRAFARAAAARLPSPLRA